MSLPDRSAWPRRLFFALLVAIVLAVGLPLAVPFFEPWSRINCRTQEIDLLTGQSRSQRVVWFAVVNESIEDTWMSRTLGHEGRRHHEPREWRKVNTFTPWQRHSPHHAYHGALHQMKQVELQLEIAGEFDEPPISDEEQRELARQMLEAWRTSGEYRSAEAPLRSFLDRHQ